MELIATFVKQSEFQFKEIADTDVDQKSNNSRTNADDSNQHPAHYLCVHVRLGCVGWGGVEGERGTERKGERKGEKEKGERVKSMMICV